jgi:glycosyltransferase involved in cell wall biosynthesis
LRGPRNGLIFVHPSDELYGADRMLLELLAALPDEIDAQVWLPTDLTHVEAPLCEELTRRGVAVRHLDLPILRRAYQNPRGLLKLAAKGRLLAKELRAARPEIVYCTTSAAFLTAPIARMSGVRHVIGHVQEIWTRTDRMALTGAAAACHSLLAISRSAGAPLPGFLQKRITVVPNATPEPDRVVPLDDRTGPLQFVMASRWNGWKGHRTLLAAWDQLADPGHLVVLGGPPASGETVDVPALVAELSHPESVTVAGEVPDPAPYLERADVVLMPSDQPEPFGLVAIEAFARARPVVASAGGGLLDIVTEGDDGWLFPPGDATALAGLLAGLNRDAVTAAATRARRTYEQNYTTDEYADRWLAALTAATGGLVPTRA